MKIQAQKQQSVLFKLKYIIFFVAIVSPHKNIFFPLIFFRENGREGEREGERKKEKERDRCERDISVD